MAGAKLIMAIITALFILAVLFLPINDYGSNFGQFLWGGAIILVILWVVVFKWL